MALTLECFCRDDPNVAGCELIALSWHLEWLNSDSLNGKQAGATAILSIGIDSHTITGGTGFLSVDTPLDLVPWRDNFDAMTITIGSDASSLQIPINDAGAQTQFHWYIQLTYLCLDPATGETHTTSARAIDTDPPVTSSCVVGGITRSITTGGGGSGLAVLLESTPLATCNGSFVTTGHFSPRGDIPTVNGTTNGTWCLCPHGGTPAAFSIGKGRLPSGQTLNAITGCIEGTPDGKDSGSEVITFLVTDTSGEVAKVTCNVLPDCTGSNIQNVGY